MQPTLLVLAAGMGSRYGGLKQIDPVGPSGETVLGYLFNRSVADQGPTIEVIPATGEPARTIAYADVRSIAFSGEDTANGKSWETWVAKKETERHAEADHVAAQAKARGHL